MAGPFQGVWPACPTLLDEAGKLDETSMRRVVRFLVDAGVDGLWLLGGNGEGVLHSDQVRRRAVEIAIDEAGPSVPTLVGISAGGTVRAIARYRPLAGIPITGVFTTPPYYYACNQREVVAFYGALAAEVDRPVVTYNNPYAAKVAIE